MSDLKHEFPHLTRWQALRWRVLRPLLVRDGEPTWLAWAWMAATDRRERKKFDDKALEGFRRMTDRSRRQEFQRDR